MEGKNVVVTGAGTGIGRAIAVELASRGASLALVGRRERLLRETEELATAAGAGVVRVHAVDVRDREALEQALGTVPGDLDGVVANAGIGGPNAPGDPGGDRFDELVATNLTGSYHTLRAFERRAGRGARAVVTSSILARIGVPGYTGYCASKAGLLGLVRAFAMEWAERGLEVNAVAPGWVDTDMATQGLQGMADAMGVDLAEARARAMADVPLGRMSEPEEIARVVAWMLSPDARGMTGHTLDVNNGAFLA